MTARRVVTTVVLVLAASLAFRNHGWQGINWTFPYFSGAANGGRLFDWRISPGEYERAARMDAESYLSYRHQSTLDAIPNTINNYGYVLVVRIARSVFPWLGEGRAVVLLQVFCHLGIVLLIQRMLPNTRQQNVFLVAYGLNPLVIRFVTFPFYYFWAVIPSVVFASIWLRRQPTNALVVASGPVQYLAFLVRPTTLFVSLATFALGFALRRRAAAVGAGAVFAVMLAASPTSRSSGIWHTAYVGLGAYDNPHGLSLADSSALQRFARETGVAMTTHAITGNWSDPVASGRYLAWARSRYMESLRDHPWLHFRNAVAFTLQAFGPGYVVGGGWLNVVTTAMGIVVLFLAVWSREYVLALGVAAYALAFTPFYPPIPAYLFGAYLLTSLILVQVIENAIRRFRPRVGIERAAGAGIIGRESSPT